MSRDPRVTAYSIGEPFGKALPKIREALIHAELCISGELDISERLQRQLSLGFEPCRLLLVDTPYLMLESVTLDRAGALLLPLHLVVFATGMRTQVQWLNLNSLEGNRLSPAALAPRAKLQTALCRALEPIALREDLDRAAS
jgi:uncharacterized protein (DUF302 family)